MKNGGKNMPRSKDYNDYLIERLQDPKKAVSYLNAVLEDCKDGSKESQQLLLLAFKRVAQAQGGMLELSKKSNLGRESLYKTLSKSGNPKLSTFTALANAMGFEIKLALTSKR